MSAVAGVVTAAFALAALPQGGARAAGEPSPYALAVGAKTVTGRLSSTDAEALKPGNAYRSSVRTPGRQLYYRVELGARENAYASAVALPAPGTKVTYSDGIGLTLQDRAGNRCDSGEGSFGAASYPRPVVASATRTATEQAGGRCAAAGTYFVVVERKGADGSSPAPWGLELRVATEPGLKGASATEAPGSWPSASAVPPGGDPVRRAGGTSFNDAAGLDQGVWKDRVQPGQSRFYRVPVDWGEQFSLDVELGSSVSPSERRPFVPSALDVTLSNPARAEVTSEGAAYTGDPATAALRPLAPVAYDNRYAGDRRQRRMGLAGWYYVQVSLNPAMAKTFGDKAVGLTLRVGVKPAGPGVRAPSYAGDPGDFQVTGEDRGAAETGAGAGRSSTGTGSAAADTAGDRGMWRGVGFAGIGLGTALVLWLAVWTVVARRRTAG
ncbi:hypothetical protein [Streptomyces tsukubensis]|uniref:hypothetical protein n=1 Tax=Streptomyces tsukubensis TaxID=83656 RepID=UPI0011808842|nr:hypothetical protein [Streptomyces tsukubensis]QFR94596.1 hypothetical protein GBW32_18035 [Streptomyces tsukubensis]